MTNPTERITFSGLDRTSGPADIPTWYANQNGVTTSEYPLPTFFEAIGDLPIGEEREVYYRAHDGSGTMRPADHFTAIVNPEWEDTDPAVNPDLPAGRNDAVWYVPTVGYDLVNPVDAYGPLVAKLRQRDATDVFGEIRVYDHGGEVHFDLFAREYTGSQSGHEFVFGLQSGYDFYARTAHYARVCALDAEERVIMRNLTDSRKRRRVKSRTRGSAGTTAADIAGWWDDELDRLEAATEAILQIVAEARSHEIPIRSVPLGITELFESNGLPTYLAEDAAKRLKSSPSMRGASGFRDPTAADCYLAGAETLSEEYAGKDNTSTFRDHLASVNRFLFEPAHAESRGLSAARKRLTGEKGLPETADPTAALDERYDDLSAARERTVSIRRRLTDMLEAADEAGDGPDSDSDPDDDPEPVEVEA